MSTILNFDVGTEVTFHDRACVIAAQTDLDQVLIRFKDNGATEAVNIMNLKAPATTPLPQTKVLDAFHVKDIDEAHKRFAAIEPLLCIGSNRGRAVGKRAQEVGVHRSTLYRWLKAYESVERKSALSPKRRGKRKARLSKKVEAIISEAIQTLYLCKQKHTQKKVIETVVRRCRAAKLKAPHGNTVRNRIKDISAKEKTERRLGAKAARDTYGAVKGSFPNADYPLAYWQIDHTLLDIILVDDEERKPMGRPWLTLSIDVFSRMITGFYITLDAPSTFSVGMCLNQSILQKDIHLEQLGVKGTWPVWGIPKTLHADNGKDFRGKSIQKSCDEYNINLEWRLVKQPEYGGHVERVFGTIAKAVHALPGTTFSNIREKGVYDSEKRAVMSFKEFEFWFTNYIVNVYHKSVHRGIDMPPIEKWREGIFGKGKIKGTGLPTPVADPERLHIDFLPYKEVTVQRDGVVWDKVHYFADVLRPWIKAQKGGKAVKFIVRRDPRDISYIYFLDPELGEYFSIPYRDLGKPSVSLWEYKAADRNLKNQGINHANEDAIFEALDILDEIEAAAVKTTKKTRRQNQRRKHHEPVQRKGHMRDLRVVVNNSPAYVDDGEFDINDDDIQNDWED